jgi:branched-subunit amino acid ABC-type transport system permease component
VLSSSIVLLLLTYALMFALAGAAVRIQLTLFRGFDLFVAGLVLFGAEMFIAVSNAVGSGSEALLVASVVSIAAVIALAVLWNVVIDRLWRRMTTVGAPMLVVSLGVSAAATGAVGVIRGPGLRQPPADLLRYQLAGVPLPAAFLIVAGAVVLVGLLRWVRRPAGFALTLMSDDPDFAAEIGLTRRDLVVSAGVVTGALTATIGAYLALSNGSTPEIGLPTFLYGAGAALLLPAATVRSSILGGIVLGLGFGVAQLFAARVTADALLFAVVLGFLWFRGTSRTMRQVR